jgi:hypothetical protein
MLATMHFRIFCLPVCYLKTKIKIYKTITLPVVLYGCETCSFTFKQEHRLRVFNNRMLGRIFGPKRGYVMEGYRKLHNEELHGLHSSQNIRVIKSTMMVWAGHAACIGKMRGTQKILVAETEEKRPLRSPKYKREDNIKMDLWKIRFVGVITLIWLKTGTAGGLL